MRKVWADQMFWCFPTNGNFIQRLRVVVNHLGTLPPPPSPQLDECHFFLITEKWLNVFTVKSAAMRIHTNSGIVFLISMTHSHFFFSVWPFSVFVRAHLNCRASRSHSEHRSVLSTLLVQDLEVSSSKAVNLLMTLSSAVEGDKKMWVSLWGAAVVTFHHARSIHSDLSYRNITLSIAK